MGIPELLQPLPHPLQNETWVRWSRYLTGPQQNAGGTMNMGIHSRAMEGVLVIVTQTWGWPRVNHDEVDHRDNQQIKVLGA